MANGKQQILLVDRNFMISVVETLKELDVRGYESNAKLVGVVHDLQSIILTNLPMDIVPNGSKEAGKDVDMAAVAMTSATNARDT